MHETLLHRRRFLQATGAALLAPALLERPAPAQAEAEGTKAARRKGRLAIVTTVFRYRSHGQHIGDRFIVGYPRDGRWHRPEWNVASMYVDQIGDNDLSAQRAREFGITVHDSIAKALCGGGSELAVDGVLLIGEHGDYPRNEKGQKLYPRYEFFQEIVDVFERSGRSVPVFNDKHLSYSGAKAARMVSASKRLAFPFLAGSSLPVTHRIPSVDLPYGAEVEEALMLGVGNSDAMDYHALEAMQCMIERRRGGESGVRAVQMIEGNAVWRALEERRASSELLEAALSRSETHLGLTERDARPQNLAHNGELPRLVEHPSAYFIEYRDGLRATLLMLNGALRDFSFACRLGSGEIVSTLFLLPSGTNVYYSACLARQIEDMLVSGVAPYPVERTQMASAVLDRCLDSKVSGHRRLETPDLDIRYRAPETSCFCRT